MSDENTEPTAAPTPEPAPNAADKAAIENGKAVLERIKVNTLTRVVTANINDAEGLAIAAHASRLLADPASTSTPPPPPPLSPEDQLVADKRSAALSALKDAMRGYGVGGNA